MAGAVIFDLDGTLIDTNRMTAQAFREFTGAHGLAMPPVNVIRDAIGLQDRFFYRAIFPDASEEQLAGLSRDVERREGEIGMALGAKILFPGVADMLDGLRARGVRLCLASTGSAAHVRDMLAAAGIRDRFEMIRFDAPDKEAMTAELLRALGGVPAVFVGDTEKDVAAAQANGLPVFGAGFGYVKAAERPLFDAVADTPRQLAALILKA